jgi:hypothetical protein
LRPLWALSVSGVLVNCARDCAREGI